MTLIFLPCSMHFYASTVLGLGLWLGLESFRRFIPHINFCFPLWYFHILPTPLTSQLAVCQVVLLEDRWTCWLWFLQITELLHYTCTDDSRKVWFVQLCEASVEMREW